MALLRDDYSNAEAFLAARPAIRVVDLLLPDLCGVLRGKRVDLADLPGIYERGMFLPGSMFALDVLGGTIQSTGLGFEEGDADRPCLPVPGSLFACPWLGPGVAQLQVQMLDHDGQPFYGDPRHQLASVLERFSARGWRPVVAPELEFFLVEPNTDADYPLKPPVGRSGRPETGRQAYSIAAVNEFDPLFDDIYAFCEAQNLDIDTLIHEEGAAQMEINLIHGDALDLADQAFLFKRTAREAAHRHKMYATFMAKPLAGEPGSAMHIHQSIVDVQTGDNIFSDAEGKPTALFESFIAGLQKYLASAMSLFGPNVNSYRRITRYNSAPINVQWGFDNRTAGLRVPTSEPQARRVENRLGGADANSYLAIAASLACGYLGMIEELKPTAPITGSAYDLPFSLPMTLADALALLRGSKPLVELFGERFVAAYCAVKENEYETFSRVISSWEREHLLLNV